MKDLEVVSTHELEVTVEEFEHLAENGTPIEQAKAYNQADHFYRQLCLEIGEIDLLLVQGGLGARKRRLETRKQSLTERAARVFGIASRRTD